MKALFRNVVGPAALVLLLLASAAGCARIDAPRSEPVAVSTSTASTVALTSPAVTAAVPAPLPPALEGAPLERLEVEGVPGAPAEYAYVALPVGARDKRVVIVGVHGAGDRPDWSCTEWQAVTAGWAFVVCPIGSRHPTDASAFLWSSAEEIASRADRAVRALRARHGAWVSDGPLIYGGWSQGASLGAQVVASRPGTYDRVVLVEVGHTPLDANAVAAGLVAGGVRRAVVSCSSLNCRQFARNFEGAARRRGLASRVNDVGLRGHWFDEPVFRTLGPTFVWMVEDEQRFAGLGAAVDARYSTD